MVGVSSTAALQHALLFPVIFKFGVSASFQARARNGRCRLDQLDGKERKAGRSIQDVQAYSNGYKEAKSERKRTLAI